MMFGLGASAKGEHIFYYQSDCSDSELILLNQSSTLCCLVLKAQQQVSISSINQIDPFWTDFAN
jgi:hypothetical protein